MIGTKRVYEPPERGDGARFLVDGVWPRGVRKDALELEAWQKDAAPSSALRKWFRHDPERWEEFRRRYFRELDEHPQGWEPIRDAARRGPVTLVYAARDERHNNAVALKEYLERRL